MLHVPFRSRCVALYTNYLLVCGMDEPISFGGRLSSFSVKLTRPVIVLRRGGSSALLNRERHFYREMVGLATAGYRRLCRLLDNVTGRVGVVDHNSCIRPNKVNAADFRRSMTSTALASSFTFPTGCSGRPGFSNAGLFVLTSV